jgi:hypothetical protein
MIRSWPALFAAILCLCAEPAVAQTPADILKGTWVADSAFCGVSTVTVTAVEENGIVRGTFICKRTGWTPVMGDKIDANAVKGTLKGTRFTMQNENGGGFDLELEGTVLKGFGRGRAESTPNSIIYKKQ